MFVKSSLLVLLTAVTAVGCGANLFKSTETSDPAEDATVALEDGDEAKAIQILEDALLDDPGNPQYLSILALAYAQRAGIEPLDFATRIAKNAGTENSAGEEGAESGDGGEEQQQPGALTTMFALMPVASAPNLLDIDTAVSILATEIPVDQRLPGDDFKLAIYQTASVIMHMKALDTNGDGEVSLEESLQMTDDSAAGLYSQIAAAEAILAASDPNDKSKQKAAQALAHYTSQIDSAPGSTDEERIRNYMGGVTTP